MDHVLEWLQVYNDGELQGRQLRRVEEHLTYCESCRAELEALQMFSSLLQEGPAAGGLMRPEWFVAQVGLRLPRRPEQTAVRRVLETGWRLIPVGLFGTWAFVQTVFIVVAGLLLAQNLPLTASVISPVLPPISGASWLMAGLQCFAGTGLNNLLEAVLCAVRYVGPLGWSVVLSTALLVVIGLLYWSWLATWWVRQRRRVAYVQ